MRFVYFYPAPLDVVVAAADDVGGGFVDGVGVDVDVDCDGVDAGFAVAVDDADDNVFVVETVDVVAS